MKLALHVPNFSLPDGPAAFAPTLAATARAADEGGFATLTVMDHWFQMKPLGGAAEPMLEAYTTLGFLAQATTRIALGPLVAGVIYRESGALIKTATTLDVLAGGRTYLGLGAGWYEREAHGLGFPFPPRAERFERLEETLQIVRQMWGPDDGAYDGRHYRLAETLCLPKPLNPPPVMIGGQGERKTLRLVAKYADACNLFANPDHGPAAIAGKLDVLREHCAREGTDFDRIRRTILWGPRFDPATEGAPFVEQMQGFAKIGVQEVHVVPGGDDPVSFVRDLGRSVVPDLAAL
jgi:F420-dependent oxidoreductase-like protein